MKPISTWLGSWVVYQVPEALETVKDRMHRTAAELLDSYKTKRPGFFDKVVLSDETFIHRPSYGQSPLCINGTYGVKFKLTGPKWPIRKIIKWKRPKKKKWSNNRRIGL